MTPHETFEAIARRVPAAEPKVSSLPSGVAMLDIVIQGVHYCAEFLPEHKVYGLSRIANSSPFWDGVEESFASADALESRIMELLKGSG
jgi:hypothetical protein